LNNIKYIHLFIDNFMDILFSISIKYLYGTKKD
jgi:hypothetical protein